MKALVLNALGRGLDFEDIQIRHVDGRRSVGRSASKASTSARPTSSATSRSTQSCTRKAE